MSRLHLKACTMPVTAYGVVDMVATDLALIDVRPDGLLLQEMAPGYGPGNKSRHRA